MSSPAQAGSWRGVTAKPWTRTHRFTVVVDCGFIVLTGRVALGYRGLQFNNLKDAGSGGRPLAAGGNSDAVVTKAYRLTQIWGSILAGSPGQEDTKP